MRIWRKDSSSLCRLYRSVGGRLGPTQGAPLAAPPGLRVLHPPLLPSLGPHGAFSLFLQKKKKKKEREREQEEEGGEKSKKQ